MDGVDPSILRIFANVRDELTSVDGKFVLRGNRIVIPDALQKRVVELVHEGHQGLVKTRSLLRSKVLFPKMDPAVDATSFPGLLRFQDGGREKTLAHTVLPPVKYSKNRGVFCHVTHNRISFSLHLISGSRNQKWLKMWLHIAGFGCKIGFFADR